ncbi:MAG: hypothetical protein IJ192_03515 [Clostridia bacterium]|nr:hypothetical protein [Clostridia bacterium]
MISNFHRKASAMALALLITSSVAFSANAADSGNPPSGSDSSNTVVTNTESTPSDSDNNAEN